MKNFLIDPQSPRRFWRISLYLYMLGILFASLQPGDPEGKISAGIGDLKNFLHVPSYAGLAFLALCSMGRFTRRERIFAFILAVSYGGINEVVQSFVPGRSCSWDDIVRNALGALIVVLVIKKAPKGVACNQ